MSEQAFDREWTLAELLDPAMLERLGPPLRQLLGGEAAILDASGRTAWGLSSGAAQRVPLILELEPLGYIASATARRSSVRGFPPRARLSAGRTC